MNDTDFIYQEILNNSKLSKEQKIFLLNKVKEEYDKFFDTQLKNEVKKYQMGAALEIASSTIPIGGAGKLGAKIGNNLLKSNLGRKISQEIGSGVASGMASGAVFGAGRGMLENKNPFLTSAEDMFIDSILGGATGALGANAIRAHKANQLRNYGNVDNLDAVSRKNYFDNAKNFYKDYIQERQIYKNGQIDFSRRGLQEQLRWNPNQVANFPELITDIKNAERLPNVLNLKPLEKPEVSHYEVYNGKKGEHYVEVLNSGKKRYYITKDTPRSSDHTTNMGTPRSPIDIINDNPETFNPPLGYDEKIFTREQIDQMSLEEFSKNESAIMKQLKEKGIPTNRELEQSSNTKQATKTKATGKGHWVTINGNHVFIED